MSYGLQCVNGSNELTLSSDGFIYGYLGKATWQSTTQPGTGTVHSSNGSSTYTITWAGDIIVAVAVPFLGYACLLSMTQSGSTWTIKAFCSAGASNSLGFDTQITADVYVWGRPTSTSGWGLAIYDASGNLTGDLSRPPLSFKERVSFTSSSSSDTQTITSYSKLAVIGSPRLSQFTSSNVGGSTPWLNREWMGAWTWASGQLGRSFVLSQYTRDDGPGGNSTTRDACNVLALEANGLT